MNKTEKRKVWGKKEVKNIKGDKKRRTGEEGEE